MRKSSRPARLPGAALVPAGAGAPRRTLLRAALGSGALLGVGACGTRGARQTPTGCLSTDLSGTEKKLVFTSWPQYLDVDEKDQSKHPTLDAFQSKTGIQVTYTEDINDNNEFFGKVQKQLAACEPVQRDLIVLTDWMAARVIRLGWMQKLDLVEMPHVQRNLLPSLRGRSFDPTGEFSVPWQAGLAGLAYNGNVTGEIRTIDELLTRPDLKGRVTCLTEMRDTMGLLLQANGHDVTNFTPAQFDDALEKLRRAVAAGQIRRFTGNDYAPELAKGDIAACLGWSGDVFQLSSDDPKVRFVVPESGAMLFSDNLLVPNKATHKANAEQLIDYYYQPAVAAKLAAYVQYICPVDGARAELEKIDPELARHPLIFPDAAMLARSKVFMALDEATERSYDQKFQSVIGL